METEPATEAIAFLKFVGAEPPVPRCVHRARRPPHRSGHMPHAMQDWAATRHVDGVSSVAVWRNCSNRRTVQVVASVSGKIEELRRSCEFIRVAGGPQGRPHQRGENMMRCGHQASRGPRLPGEAPGSPLPPCGSTWGGLQPRAHRVGGLAQHHDLDAGGGDGGASLGLHGRRQRLAAADELRRRVGSVHARRRAPRGPDPRPAGHVAQPIRDNLRVQPPDCAGEREPRLQRAALRLQAHPR